MRVITKRVTLSLLVVGAVCWLSSQLAANIDHVPNGDVNADGDRNIVDVVQFLDWLFRDGQEPEQIWCPVEPAEPTPCDLRAEDLGIATRPVLWNGTGEHVGSAWLSRNSRGITAMVQTTGVPVGHAGTAWWVIFNYPGECVAEGGCRAYNQDVERPGVQGDILFADGFVVTEENQVFGAFLEVGDATESVGEELRGVPPTGLLNPSGADVHLVIRSHGPVVPEIEELMIRTVHGGCTRNLEKGELPDEVGECADLQAVRFEMPREVPLSANPEE